jgi:CheY-like chemotaxis protein
MAEDHRERPMILIAERDANVREFQSAFLARAGFDVEFVHDGVQALERARAIAPVLFITEILIPKMDGLMVCRAMRADPALVNLPVIVFSILTAGARAQEAGATAFLRKPMIESVFLAHVSAAIATRVPSFMVQQ